MGRPMKRARVKSEDLPGATSQRTGTGQVSHDPAPRPTPGHLGTPGSLAESTHEDGPALSDGDLEGRPLGHRLVDGEGAHPGHLIGGLPHGGDTHLCDP